MTNNLRDLDRLHLLPEGVIVRGAIGARMNAPMAVRTQCYNKPGVIRAAIGKPANVVRLEIGHAIDAKERSRLATPLAMSFGTRNNIVAHVATAFEHGCSRLRFARSGVGRGESALAQLAEVRRRWRHFFNLVDHSGDGAQLEHDGVAQISETIRRLFDVVRLIDVLVFEPKTVRVLPEEQKARTIGRVAGDGRVASLHRHGTDLAFSKVFIYPVGPKAVSVSMRQAFFAGDYDNQLVLGRRNNAALLLPAEACVDIGPSVIDPAPLETPRHSRPPVPIDRSLVAYRNCMDVNLVEECSGITRSTQIVQHISNAWLVRTGLRLVVRHGVRIGFAWHRVRHRIRHIDRRNGRGRAWQVWARIYGKRHGQSSLVNHVQHASRHIVSTGRAA